MYRENLAKLKEKANRLKQEILAVYLAYKDPRVPMPARIFAACVVAYALSPIDLIPDPIPILGYLDDLILVPIGIALAIKMIPSDVLQECREKARKMNHTATPKNWTAAALIIAVWIFIFVLTLIFIQRLLAGSSR